MTQTTLIVARMDPVNAPEVGGLFAQSDATELPHLIGVQRRQLLTFHDLYFHLIEADGNVAPRVREYRDHPGFRELNADLAKFVLPYHPSWREPKDAIAKPFYHWQST